MGHQQGQGDAYLWQRAEEAWPLVELEAELCLFLGQREDQGAGVVAAVLGAAVEHLFRPSFRAIFATSKAQQYGGHKHSKTDKQIGLVVVGHQPQTREA